MPEEGAKEAFEKWREEYGYLATEIYADLEKESHLLDMDDQNHAKWHGSDLGVLIVLPYEHVVAFGMENISGDFDHSPLHSYVFSTITTLIMNSFDAHEGAE